MKSKEMIKLLEQNGFVTVRIRGSHYFLKNPNTGRTTTVPFHPGDLKPSLEKKIMKDAGLE